MPGRLTHLLRNKIAVAIFGAVLIAGAGSAAALAASGGNLQTPFASQTPSSQHDGDNDANDDHGNVQNANQNGGHQAEGTIASIDSAGSRFVVKAEHGASMTVVVNSSTVFTDGLHSFADLKTGMFVEIDGNVQSNGTLSATRIHGENEGADDTLNDDHSGSGSGGSGRGGHDDGSPHN